MTGVDPDNFENFRNQMKMKTQTLSEQLKDVNEYSDASYLVQQTNKKILEEIDETNWQYFWVEGQEKVRDKIKEIIKSEMGSELTE